MRLDEADAQLSAYEVDLNLGECEHLLPKIDSLIAAIRQAQNTASNASTGNPGPGAVIGGLLGAAFGPFGAIVGAGIGAAVTSGGDTPRQQWEARLGRALRLREHHSRNQECGSGPTSPNVALQEAQAKQLQSAIEQEIARHESMLRELHDGARSRAVTVDASIVAELKVLLQQIELAGKSTSDAQSFRQVTFDITKRRNALYHQEAVRWQNVGEARSRDPEWQAKLRPVTPNNGISVPILPSDCAGTPSAGEAWDGVELETDSPADTQAIESQEPSRRTSRLDEERYLATVLRLVDVEINQIETSREHTRLGWRELDSADWTGHVLQFHRETSEKAQLGSLYNLRDSPYFGRVDFVEEDAPNAEIVYIGRSSLELEPRIYDWRAPICSIYYRFNPGPSYYDAPIGRVSGTMKLKRSYEIRDGELRAVFDAGGKQVGSSATIADPLLHSLLSRQTTGRMRQIVQSIQSEQDSIIRDDARVVAVEGPAGSGKTVVALHRAAYLLYHLRSPQGQVFSAQRMVVFSPNRVFSDYVSRVLPDLNESEIRQVIFEDLVQNGFRAHLDKRRKGKHGPPGVESRHDFHEFLLRNHDDTAHHERLHSIRAKSSLTTRDAILVYMERLEQEIGSRLQDVVVEGGRVVISRAELLQRLLQNPSKPLTERLQSLLVLLEERRDRLTTSASARSGWNKQIGEQRVDLKRLIGEYCDKPLLEVYQDLWEHVDGLRDGLAREVDWGMVRRITLCTFDDAMLRHEDVAPLLLLAGLYFGFPPLGRVIHAVIDEVQDYSAIELDYIRRCLPAGCTMTLVGDPYQTVNPVGGTREFSALRRVFGTAMTHLELTRSYRSTSDIVEFAKLINAGSAHTQAVRQTGKVPRVCEVDDPEARRAKLVGTIRELLDSGNKLVALICKDRAEAIECHGQLPDTLGAILMTSDSGGLSEGVFVMPVFLAKGLEFDAVIIPDASAARYRTDVDRNLLYIACTRALHELHIFCAGPPPPYLAHQPLA